MSRKPRADSRLKTLPPERQEQIAQYARNHTLLELKDWLWDDGLKTSLAALSEFLSWYALRQQLARNESTVETLLSNLPEGTPPEKIQEIGQAFFSALALEQQDPKVWHLTQQLNLKREQLHFDREKFQFNAAKKSLELLDTLKAIKADDGLDEDTKISRARQALFGVTPE